MVIMMQPEQVSAYWDAIKHGLIIANRPNPMKEQEFCTKVLERLLSGKAQCWVSVTDVEGQRVFNAFGITTIEETSLGEVYLFLHSLYAFRIIPEIDLKDMLPILAKFADSVGANKLVTFTKVARLKSLYESWGFTQETMLFVKEL